jgi:hypothetical protein
MADEKASAKAEQAFLEALKILVSAGARSSQLHSTARHLLELGRKICPLTFGSVSRH